MSTDTENSKQLGVPNPHELEVFTAFSLTSKDKKTVATGVQKTALNFLVF